MTLTVEVRRLTEAKVFLKARWKPNTHDQGLLSRCPNLVAATTYRHFVAGRCGISNQLILELASGALPAIGKRSHVRVMTLELTDDEAALLLKELNGIIDGDRYFLSDRIRTLEAIRAKIRPEPTREPLPPPPARALYRTPA